MQDVWDYHKDKTIEDNTKIQDMRYSMLSVVFCHSWIRDIYKRIKCSYIEYWYRARFDFILMILWLALCRPEEKGKYYCELFYRIISIIAFSRKIAHYSFCFLLLAGKVKGR